MFNPSGHQFGYRTHPGLQRQVNEDSLGTPEGFAPGLLVQKGQLYVVADGMGGHKAGQTASDIAVQTVMREYYAAPAGMEVGQALDVAIQAANRQIHAMAHEPAYAGMGTTIVAAVLRGGQLTVANVGDSRAYLIGQSGIRQITCDHTWVAEQVREGTLTDKEAAGHSYRHVVTRSLGGQPQVEVDIFRETVHSGDIVFLCSDGLSGQVSDDEIQRTAQANSPQKAADKLIDLANQREGPDNITAIVIALAPTRFGRMRKAVSNIQTYFLGLPVHKRIVVIAAVTALIVVGGLFLGGFLVFTQPPVERQVQVGSVRYVVRPGETRELLAAYFGVQPEEIALEPIQPEQTLTIRPPAQYGYYVSGLVKSVEHPPVGDAILLKLVNSSSDYEVVCKLQGEKVPTINPEVAPTKGNIVTVFGWARGGNRIEAVIVDVAKGIYFWTNWRNWYYAAEDEPVWLYSSFSEFTLGMNAEHPLELALVRGTWSKKGDPANFDYDPDDLYLWDGEAYSSAVPVETRKLLTDRLELELPTATATVELPDIEPTATPRPPVVGIVEPEVGVWMVSNPHNPEHTHIIEKALPQDTQVEIIGEVQGVPIDGDDVWYHVKYEKLDGTVIEGYMYRGGIKIERKIIEGVRND